MSEAHVPIPDTGTTPSLASLLARSPLIAILRGVTPAEVVAIGQVLIAAGFAMIEVPLNSPKPLESIRLLAEFAPPDCMIGAGTVTNPGSVERIAQAGGRLIVMPHSDAAVIRAAKACGLLCTPGVATPTEGFAALANGADGLKLFPADALGPAVLRAWRSVFPPATLFVPVGGITPESMRPFLSAGAAGFGLGSALYKPGSTPSEVAASARAFTDALHHTRVDAH